MLFCSYEKQCNSQSCLKIEYCCLMNGNQFFLLLNAHAATILYYTRNCKCSTSFRNVFETGFVPSISKVLLVFLKLSTRQSKFNLFFLWSMTFYDLSVLE